MFTILWVRGRFSQSNQIHCKTNFQYHHRDLYCDITLYLATTIDLTLRSIWDLCEIGPLVIWAHSSVNIYDLGAQSWGDLHRVINSIQNTFSYFSQFLIRSKTTISRNVHELRASCNSWLRAKFVHIFKYQNNFNDNSNEDVINCQQIHLTLLGTFF